jgi:hypothetical protein
MRELPRLSYHRPVRCAFCHHEMAYIHGHAACIGSGCPMYGVNQAECCDGETAEAAPVRTSEISAGPRTSVDGGGGGGSSALGRRASK